MTQAVAIALKAPTYADVAPLDWFQLRALLWEGREQLEGGEYWEGLTEFINSHCRQSTPLSAGVLREVWQKLSEFDPALLDLRDQNAGYRLWTRILYEGAHRLFGESMNFMNLGYVGSVDEEPPELEAGDEPSRLFIQLYHHLLADCRIEGQRVLEIGCGVGGGCRYLARYFHPSSTVALDLLQANLLACARQVKSGLSFAGGDAENLPFASEAFDVVLNLESSHSYGSVEDFLSEAMRVLRPGGQFLFADLRPVEVEWGPGRTVLGLQQQLRETGWLICGCRNITANVLKSMDLQDAAKQAGLAACASNPADLVHYREILLCQGSELHRQLAGGEIQYWSFRCQKPALDS